MKKRTWFILLFIIFMSFTFYKSDLAYAAVDEAGQKIMESLKNLMPKS